MLSLETGGEKSHRQIYGQYFRCLILLTYPKAKIIHLQHEPLEVILSCYQQFFQISSPHLATLENIAYYYKYTADHIAYWKSMFPGSIISVSYEELVSSQEATTRKLLDFCELQWEDACLEHQNSNRAINTASSMQVRSAVYNSSVYRWKKYSEYLKPAAEILGLNIAID
jgi:sulfotransferase family protein